MAAFASLRALRKSGGYDRHFVYLVGIAAARKVVDRSIETLKNRSVGVKSAEPLGDLVSDVARFDPPER